MTYMTEPGKYFSSIEELQLYLHKKIAPAKYYNPAEAISIADLQYLLASIDELSHLDSIADPPD